MNGAFYIGAMGLHAQQSALDIVANNITNMNTPAYKRGEARFSEMVAAPEPNANVREGNVNISSGMMLEPVSHVFTQGELRQTGRPLDVAIDGEGFIELLGSGGRSELWRGGTLKVNADGFLAASDGLPLKAMISVPDGAEAISIGRDGVVSAVSPDEGQPRELGRIEIVRVKDMDQIQSLGGALYALLPEAANAISVTPGEEGGGVIVQGAIEGSNVQLTDEMVTLMLMQRAYAASAQVVQAGDQLMSIANGLRRV